MSRAILAGVRARARARAHTHTHSRIPSSSNAIATQINETQKEPRVVVESEDQPERVLLETRICKEDGFHKQQGMSVISPQSLSRAQLDD